MSYSGYSPAPSATFTRSASIDPTKTVTYASQLSAPTMSIVLNRHSEPQLTSSSQLIGVPPVQTDIRPMIKSSNEVIRTRGPDPTPSSGHAPGFTGLRPNYKSANDADEVASEGKAPTGVGQREPSNNNNGASDEPEPVNPHDYVGISLVGNKFKQVNPEAYYVEKDDPYYY